MDLKRGEVGVGIGKGGQKLVLASWLPRSQWYLAWWSQMNNNAIKISQLSSLATLAFLGGFFCRGRNSRSSASHPKKCSGVKVAEKQGNS